MSEDIEATNRMEVERPKVLYRGSRKKLDSLKPQPILENEKVRFPKETDSVVFASEYRQEALAYAIASRQGVGSFLIVPFEKSEGSREIGWRLEFGCKSAELPRNEITHLYEISPDDFSQNTEGGWYSTNKVVPDKRIELTIDEALKEFDEVKFLG